jgi:ESF2/ABP1 family protein
LRNQIAQSKKEQAEYLRQVERAKNHDKAQDKKRARLERKGDSAAGAVEESTAEKQKKGREFEQKAVVQKNKGPVVDKKLGQVLDSLF